MNKKDKIIIITLIFLLFAVALTFLLCYVAYQRIILLILFYACLVLAIFITLVTLYKRGKEYNEAHKEEKKLENKPHITSGYIPDDITEEDDYGNTRKVSEDDLWDEHEFWN